MGNAVTPQFLGGARYGMVSASRVFATNVTSGAKAAYSRLCPKLNCPTAAMKFDCPGRREDISADTMMIARCP